MIAGRVRVEPLRDAVVPRALAYLSLSPYEHVFLSYLISSGAMRDDVRVALDGDAVAGAALLGSHIVLASEPFALPAIAESARDRNERAIVGPRETVSAYWRLLAPWHRPPRLVRDRQPLMVVDEATLRGAPTAGVSVRPARENEWRTVSRNSAAMISGEIEADAGGDRLDFGAGIQRMIRLGLWWVGERDGRLCFFCNVGAWSEQTAQLQGIWTPPELRERGLATAALAAVCRTLLDRFPTLSLYVNDFNAPARALYHRLGFRDVGELQTIFF